jgi:hypothetical protein
LVRRHPGRRLVVWIGHVSLSWLLAFTFRWSRCARWRVLRDGCLLLVV